MRFFWYSDHGEIDLSMRRLEKTAERQGGTMAKLTKKQAALNVGKLSQTSKLGCKSWGIPAEKCITGSKLRLIVGSVCAMCYALKGAYVWASTRFAYKRRLWQFDNVDRQVWIDSMVCLLSGQRKFRFFDSGDLQSVDMLDAFVSIARRLPATMFWLPTREYALVNRWSARVGNSVPANLNIVLSAHMVDSKPVSTDTYSTTVVVKVAKRRNMTQAQKVERYQTAVAKLAALGIVGKVCPSSIQDGACGACETCFTMRPSGKVSTVAYISH